MDRISKLIIDSGATSWNYAYINEDRITQGQLEGYNAYIHGHEALIDNLEQMKNDVPDMPAQIYFYGAGYSGKREDYIRDAFSRYFNEAAFHGFSDIMAVAHASGAKSYRWVGILGTGSNLALYDGRDIVHIIPSMGYIFGDEGSGRDILKRLVVQYYRKSLTQGTRDILSRFIHMDYPAFMEVVYRENAWPRLSAKWMKDLGQHWEHPEIKRIARQSIGDFQNLMINAQAYHNAPIFLVGGVAEAHKVYICNLWKECASTPIQVTPSPLPGLIKYYQDEH